jgi:hypothetical protein
LSLEVGAAARLVTLKIAHLAQVDLQVSFKLGKVKELAELLLELHPQHLHSYIINR